MKLSNAMAAVVLAVGAGSASAQAIKPGLWEIATQMQGGSGEMASAMAQAQKQMESMPPEQRKMMQDMMAKQGVQMGTSSGGGMTVKICMTQEMVKPHDVPARPAANKHDCHHPNRPGVGNTKKFSFV